MLSARVMVHDGTSSRQAMIPGLGLILSSETEWRDQERDAINSMPCGVCHLLSVFWWPFGSPRESTPPFRPSSVTVLAYIYLCMPKSTNTRIETCGAKCTSHRERSVLCLYLIAVLLNFSTPTKQDLMRPFRPAPKPPSPEERGQDRAITCHVTIRFAVFPGDWIHIGGDCSRCYLISSSRYRLI